MAFPHTDNPKQEYFWPDPDNPRKSIAGIRIEHMSYCETKYLWFFRDELGSASSIDEAEREVKQRLIPERIFRRMTQ